MSKITEIHESGLYGILVETGCSTATASKLMNVNGASKTVFYSIQPYSKLYEEQKYGKFSRSVSMDFIHSVLNTESGRPTQSNDICNFILASSWQLNNDADPLQYAHGWFGLYDLQRNVKHFLHFTFNRNLSWAYRDLLAGKHDPKRNYPFTREMMIDVIGQIGVNILNTAISGDINEFDLNDIKCDFFDSKYMGFKSYVALDMAYKCDYVNPKDGEETIEVNYDLLINTLEKYKGDYFLTFESDKPTRIEDLLRRNDEITFQKGSFNPIHHGHVEMMKLSCQKHNSLLSFLISTFRYDKPHIDKPELVQKIQQINRVGYPAVVCKSVLYYETFDLLKLWSYNKRFYFPLGMDTMLRIFKTDSDYVENQNLQNAGKNALMGKMTIRGYVEKVIRNNPNFKFLVFDRVGYDRAVELAIYDPISEYIYRADDGVSSTKIRNGEMKNQLDI